MILKMPDITLYVDSVLGPTTTQCTASTITETI